MLDISSVSRNQLGALRVRGRCDQQVQTSSNRRTCQRCQLPVTRGNIEVSTGSGSKPRKIAISPSTRITCEPINTLVSKIESVTIPTNW